MQIYISYFSRIKGLSPDILPVSTAMWDPKWFHNGTRTDLVFTDKRGVINGVRMKCLSPYKLEHQDCSSNCGNTPDKCRFIKEYNEYLHTLDFKYVYAQLEQLNKFYDKDICLMVYEQPENPCSERGPLIKWFEENGIIIKEL